MITLTIPITPVAKQRPRLAMYGRGKRRRVTAYTPEKTKEFEEFVRNYCLQQMSENGWEPFDTCYPLRVTIDFYFKRPKTSKREHHIITPDLDNLVKSLLDGIQGALIVDDKVIVKIHASKYYTDGEPHVYILLAKHLEAPPLEAYLLETNLLKTPNQESTDARQQLEDVVNRDNNKKTTRDNKKQNSSTKGVAKKSKPKVAKGPVGNKRAGNRTKRTTKKTRGTTKA